MVSPNCFQIAHHTDAHFVVVESKPAIQPLLQPICHSVGSLSSLTTAEQAWAFLERAEPITALFAAWRLSDGLGVEIVRLVRKRAYVPTLVSCACSSADRVRVTSELGAKLVCEPVCAAELDHFVGEALACQRARDDCWHIEVDRLAVAAQLTNRQQHIVLEAVRGHSRTQIAKRLGVARSTLKDHIHSLLEKCEARNLDEVVIRILRNCQSRS